MQPLISPLLTSHPPPLLPPTCKHTPLATHAHRDISQRAAVLQGGNQLPRPDQKRLVEVRRIGRPWHWAALSWWTRRGPRSSGTHKTYIGMDGELLAERLLEQIEEQAKGQPVIAIAIVWSTPSLCIHFIGAILVVATHSHIL